MHSTSVTFLPKSISLLRGLSPSGSKETIHLSKCSRTSPTGAAFERENSDFQMQLNCAKKIFTKHDAHPSGNPNLSFEQGFRPQGIVRSNICFQNAAELRHIYTEHKAHPHKNSNFPFRVRISLSGQHSKEKSQLHLMDIYSQNQSKTDPQSRL